SEAHDDALALVYYNYRHYDPKDGRWKSRDLNDERMVSLLYPFANNNSTGNIDIFGLISDEDARLMYGELGGCILSLQKINGKNQYVPNAGIADAFVSLRSVAKRNKKVYRKPPLSDPVNQKAWEVIKATEGGIDKSGGAMYYCISSLPPCGNNLTCATCRCQGTTGWGRGKLPLKIIIRSQLKVGRCTVYFYDFDKTNVVSGWCSKNDQRNSYSHPEECK
ncbi:MAG: RHS repeat-associated core domain-containing protein, partial [Kiritimatiellia bacterium]